MEEYYRHKDLIKIMPVDDHLEVILKRNWTKEVNGEVFDCLKEIFGQKDKIYISRKEIKIDAKEGRIQDFLIKSILWGYPNGRMNIKKIDLDKLISVELIEQYEILHKRSNIEWNVKGEEYLKFPGLKLSTISKFFYFLDININDNPPLILDSQIIQRLTETKFKDSKFAKLTYDNAPEKYVQYLEFMKKIASEMGCKSENVEMFLFLFGKIL